MKKVVKKAVRVLVSGYYGFGNVGDEALLQALSAGLAARGHAVTVLSRHPAETRRLHGVGAASRRSLLPALLRHDALLSGGGGLLQDKTSARSLGYYLGVLRLAKALGKRTVVYGQSVGPLSEAGERAVARALRGVRVAVRDETSKDLLATLGVEARLVADAALLLEPPHVSPSPDAPVLLVPRGGYPVITEALGALAARLGAQGVRVAALALHAAEDAPHLELMKGTAPGLELLHARTPGEALAHIANASYVVSARLHGLILAAVAGRPFCGVVYDPKVAAFLEESGARAHHLPPDVSRLMEDVLLRRGPEPVQVEALRERAAAGLEWLDAALRG